MKPRFDLLGDPIPESRGKPGRTGHVATSENARRIRALLVAGLKPAQIAEQIGISTPTLKKHYFSSGKVNVKLAREMAVSEMRARNILRLDAEADKGNVSAMRALSTEIEKVERDMIEDAIGKSSKPKEQSLGVKQQRELMGYEADDELDAELMREADDRLH